MEDDSEVERPWSGKTVFVTGASGFLGRHLVRALCERGARVLASSRVNRTESDRRVEWVCMDPSQCAEVRSTVIRVRPDTVFHLSSLANAKRDATLVLPTFKAELESSVNMLSVAADLGVKRLVMVGSPEAPELGTGASSPYAAAKWASAMYADMYRSLYGAPIVVPRVFMTYGPGQPEWKVIPYVIRCLMAGQSPRLGSPGRLIDWIYVSDAVEGLLAAACANANVDIGSGRFVSIAEVAARLQRLINPSVPLVHDPETERVNEQIRLANADETFRRVGWRARITLDDGLRRAVDAMRPWARPVTTQPRTYDTPA